MLEGARQGRGGRRVDGAAADSGGGGFAAAGARSAPISAAIWARPRTRPRALQRRISTWLVILLRRSYALTAGDAVRSLVVVRPQKFPGLLFSIVVAFLLAMP